MSGPVIVPTDLESALAVTRSSGILATLSDQDLDRLKTSAEFIEVPTGGELRTRQKRIYVLTSGKVSCRLVDAGGIQYQLSTGHAGDVFGEIAFSDHHRQSASPPKGQKIYIEAIEPVTMIGFLPEAWRSVVDNNLSSQKFLLGLTRDRLLRMNEFAAHAVQVDPKLEDQQPRTLSDRAADWLSSRIGQWKFVIGAASFMAVYSAVNLLAARLGITAWDEYPFVFLNLILSTASGFAVPILLISQNRQSHIDRTTARASQRMILNLSREIGELRSSQESTPTLDQVRQIVKEELNQKN